MSSTHTAIERAILALLAERGTGKTICPSDAARVVCPDEWRGLMDSVREVAAGMVAAGKITVTRRGESVDPLRANGPIRIGIRQTPTN